MSLKTDIISLVPKNLLSKCAGMLADKTLPPQLLLPFLRLYCDRYNVDMEEAANDLETFTTFNAFFTRSLKPGARPICDASSAVAAPTDGRIYSQGPIQNKALLQAKDVYYSLTELIGEAYADQYDGGYQMTVYLSPGDYHCIHAPYSCRPDSFSYFPGNLWPVNDEFLGLISGLFSINERIFTEFTTATGQKFGMVAVGAMVVGKIELEYINTVSNADIPPINEFQLTNSPQFERGEKIGHFSLGSTVILLFPPNTLAPDPDMVAGTKIKMGQEIGRFTNP